MNREPLRPVLPRTIISRETLEWVGYTKAKSDELWSKWENRPADREAGCEGDANHYHAPWDDPDTFKEFILDHIMLSKDDTHCSGGPEEDDDDEEWEACMDRWGINERTQAAIMDPSLERWRPPQGSCTCLLWVRDTMDMKYYNLGTMLGVSRPLPRPSRARPSSSVAAADSSGTPSSRSVAQS